MKHTTNHFVLIFVMSFTCSAQAMVARLGQMAAAQRVAMSGASSVFASNNAFTARALPMAQPIRHYSQKSDDEKQEQHHSLDELRKQVADQTNIVNYIRNEEEIALKGMSGIIDGPLFLIWLFNNFPADNLLDPLNGAPSYVFTSVGLKLLLGGLAAVAVEDDKNDLKKAEAVLAVQMKELLDAQMEQRQQDANETPQEESEIKAVA